jgi:hypothetical protein
MERFIEKYQYSYTCRNSHISYVKMALKSKIVAAQIGNQLGSSFPKWNKTYQLLYRENRRHKAVLKTM